MLGISIANRGLVFFSVRFHDLVLVLRRVTISVFKILYWAALFSEVAIRAPFQKTWKAATKIDRRVSRTDVVLLGSLWIPMIILPLIYSVTNWLDFANYHLPEWMGWFGVFLLACALFVFTRAHLDLKSNWSPTLEIFEGHTLVTNGIYGYIRHPMYASQWLWGMAQILLLQNWLAGLPLISYFSSPFTSYACKQKKR